MILRSSLTYDDARIERRAFLRGARARQSPGSDQFQEPDAKGTVAAEVVEVVVEAAVEEAAVEPELDVKVEDQHKQPCSH
jgi:hypothetical protein